MSEAISSSDEPRFVRPPRAIVVGFIVLVSAIVLGLIALRVSRGSLLPLADPATYRAAIDRWQANRLADYDVEIKVEGRQPAVYRVEVRRGEPKAAFRNDQPLLQRRTFRTWTVDGMFETLAGDMARLAPEGPNREIRRDPPFVLRVRFDDRYGYPAEYQRSEYGTGIDVEWRVILFEPQQDSSDE